MSDCICDPKKGWKCLMHEFAEKGVGKETVHRRQGARYK
jgi:hypothetical protein